MDLKNLRLGYVLGDIRCGIDSVTQQYLVQILIEPLGLRADQLSDL